MIADIHATGAGYSCPTPPPPDLQNADYIEDMRSRLGELAQIARADVPDGAARAAHMQAIDNAEAVHDYLVRIANQLRRKEAAAA